MKHWLVGIGAYWCIVEMLYEEWWYISIDEYERIAFELRTSENVIQEVINDYWLFTISNNTFHSNSVIDRLNQRMDKSEKARISVQKRWKKREEENTNVLRTQNDSNTIKERKGKEIKEKKIKTETVSIETEQAPIDSKEIVIKKEYGNEDINKMLLLLKNTVGCDDFSESKDWQRKYWKHFLTLWKNIWNSEFLLRLEWILSDSFKAKNCNSLKYLYNQMKSFIHSPVISNTTKVW